MLKTRSDVGAVAPLLSWSLFYQFYVSAIFILINLDQYTLHYEGSLYIVSLIVKQKKKMSEVLKGPHTWHPYAVYTTIKYVIKKSIISGVVRVACLKLVSWGKAYLDWIICRSTVEGKLIREMVVGVTEHRFMNRLPRYTVVHIWWTVDEPEVLLYNKSNTRDWFICIYLVS